MSISAFNSSSFPRVSPWECFSAEWFVKLASDGRLLAGLQNSLFIGLGVVLVSVPMGLAGALLLTQVRERVRPWYYTIVISPILVPGVVLGISTLLFWDRVAHMFGATRDSLFYDGFFLTIIGQSTFISAYTMLVFISRLQRFDRAQEEAALDLGATHWQSFTRILVPFLKPAIASASVLAFLASFENYNTTVFTAISTSTLTTVLASKVRYGIDPSISALAFTIVAITLVGAAVHEVFKRRELKRDAQALEVAAGGRRSVDSQRAWFAEPALWMIALVVVAGVGTVTMAGTVGVQECKVMVQEQKRELARQRTEALRERNRQRAAEREAQREAQAGEQAEGVEQTPATAADETPESAPRTGTSNFEGIFGGGNLAPGSSGPDTNTESEPSTEALPAPQAPDTRSDTAPEESTGPVGTENFQGIFGGENLAPGAGEAATQNDSDDASQDR